MCVFNKERMIDGVIQTVETLLSFQNNRRFNPSSVEKLWFWLRLNRQIVHFFPPFHLLIEKECAIYALGGGGGGLA